MWGHKGKQTINEVLDFKATLFIPRPENKSLCIPPHQALTNLSRQPRLYELDTSEQNNSTTNKNMQSYATDDHYNFIVFSISSFNLLTNSLDTFFNTSKNVLKKETKEKIYVLAVHNRLRSCKLFSHGAHVKTLPKIWDEISRR